MKIRRKSSYSKRLLSISYIAFICSSILSALTEGCGGAYRLSAVSLVDDPFYLSYSRHTDKCWQADEIDFYTYFAIFEPLHLLTPFS